MRRAALRPAALAAALAAAPAAARGAAVSIEETAVVGWSGGYLGNRTEAAAYAHRRGLVTT